LLRECIHSVTGELRRWANSDSSMYWLWLLRRLPYRIFAGRLLTTLGYDQALAAVITGRSNAEDLPTHGQAGSLVYPIDAAIVARLARFCEGVRLLSDLHRCFRWSGKGARFRFQKGQLPNEEVESEIRTAVETYDHRTELSGHPLGRLGSNLTPTVEAREDEVLLGVQAVVPALSPTLSPGVHITQGTPSEWRTIANFSVGFLSLAA
jgi:hypothetical protein